MSLDTLRFMAQLLMRCRKHIEREDPATVGRRELLDALYKADTELFIRHDIETETL